jgi:hypothetical protein
MIIFTYTPHEGTKLCVALKSLETPALPAHRRADKLPVVLSEGIQRASHAVSEFSGGQFPVGGIDFAHGVLS